MLQKQQNKLFAYVLASWKLKLDLLSTLILLFGIIISQPATSQDSVNSIEEGTSSPLEQLEAAAQENLQLEEIERERLELEEKKLQLEEKKLQLEQDQAIHRRRWGVAGTLGTLTTIVGTVATIIGGTVVFFNYRVSAKNLKVVEDRQITERFTAAINQLGTTGDDKIAIRLGGSYALERIAKDSEKDHWTIMEVLTEFIRAISPSLAPEESFDSDVEQANKELFPGITRDAQAALTVIGRREERTESLPLAISKANLRDADLRNAMLSGANLTSS